MRKTLRWILRFFGAVALIIVLRIILGSLLQPASPDETQADQELRARAIALHQDAILLDGHNDLPTWIQRYGFDMDSDGNEPGDKGPFLYYIMDWFPGAPDGSNVRTHTDFARMHEGGLDAQFFSIWVDCKFYLNAPPGASFRQATDMAEVFTKQLDRHSEQISLTTTASDVETLASEGKFAALLGLEGGHAIENDLSNLDRFFDLGIRYMTLTHSCTNDWADSASDTDDPDIQHHGGLTDFGRQVVERMNQLGIIVDISHVSDDTFWDVLETTSAPVIASHSSVRAIANHERNLSDEMLIALAENGGLAMINFRAPYLDPNKSSEWKLFSGWYWFTHPGGTDTPLSLVFDHIDHVVKTAGIDHVGLGSDFDGVMMLPKGLEDVGDFPNVTIGLLQRGYSEEDIRKILGGNALRVLREVERIASIWMSVDH